MDQRVFNKFYLAAMRCGARGFYEQVEWFAEPPPPRADTAPAVRCDYEANLTLRVLDPVAISHGMNYFWRRAFTLPGAKAPAVVHVNGVDPKLYFLRDRGLWFIDDWEERFGGQEFFLLYDHP